MNTPRMFPFPASVPALGLCLLCMVVSAGADEPEAGLTDSIFYGMELYVEEEGVEYPLVGFKDGLHLFMKNGELHGLPWPVKINFKKTIRHSDRFAALFDFNSTPYSSELVKMMDRYADVSVQQSNQQAELDYALSYQAGLVAAGGGNVGPLGEADLAYLQSVTLQQGAAAQASASEASNLSNLTTTLWDMEREMADKTHQENFDALILNLKIQSPEPLTDCYLFVRSTYLDPASDKPETKNFKVRFVEVGDIDANHPETVRFTMTDFPEGPQILDMTYHLYSGPLEIATDFSDQRIQLSEDEAYDFLFADLFSRSDPENSNPELFKLLPEIPSDLSARTLEEASISLVVQADGNISDVRIENCPRKDLTRVKEIIAQARFLPAIENGIPVDHRVEFPLNSIFR